MATLIESRTRLRIITAKALLCGAVPLVHRDNQPPGPAPGQPHAKGLFAFYRRQAVIKLQDTTAEIRAEFYLLSGGNLRARFYRNGKVATHIEYLELTKEQALEMSIQKWASIEKFIKQGKRVFNDRGPRTCALCGLYRDADCEGCPVEERTGQKCCDGTPYEELGYKMFSHPMELEMVSEELEFLKSLRTLDTRRDNVV